ncbi:tRNA-uridine aminocarboxypropyltransferase [Anaeromicrobium sediminis]|uniref:tRNA-uridine aminocarboxypropyltransferase n=1 Tax=Anaeromicrobium sediminis TaxID=1478221 RepID=A0A267MI17_9FIRM|nr:tRNA-uridine aminocarboxypropyltransferase [Anaeromicrobium sediminis]PAB59052.1 hypothetical protein CCE28_12785 [Anaeromicrobium sediminis]
MEEKFKVKEITSKYKSCNNCGLPLVTCICDKYEKINTEAEFVILSTLREVKKPSNTARLLKLLNEDKTKILIWERTGEPKELIHMIDNPKYDPYIVFPIYNEELEKRKKSFNRSEKIPLFILIDGTWKEARRILRKSYYLDKLPILPLEGKLKTEYDLRRGIESLCTIEACIELLKMNNESVEAQRVNDIFHLFVKSYKAGVCGHELKNV